MKKIGSIFLMLLIAAFSFVAMGQSPPAPQLLFHKTGANPAFVSVQGLTMDFVDGQDYLFGYGESMQCYGSYQVLGEVSIIPLYGDDGYDPGKQGFDFREAINLGYYDAQTGDFYKLSGTSTGWQSGESADMVWMPLGLYKYQVDGVTEGVSLIVDAELAEVKIVIKGPDRWDVVKDNESYFFNVGGKNVDNYIVTASQGGELVKVRRWFNDQWNNYQYTPESNDENVTFTAVGQDNFTNEIVQAQKLVIFNDDEQPEPSGVLYANEYFKIVEIDSYLYLEAVTSTPVYVNFTVDGRSLTKYVVSSSGTKPGDQKKIISTNGRNSITINWAMYKGIDGLKDYQWTSKQMINEELTW